MLINPNWLAVDLDPCTWRYLGRFINVGQYFRAEQPGEHGLYVLHEDGRPLRVVDSQTGVQRNMEFGFIDDPQALAEELHSTGQWDRVHVVNKNHLAAVSQEAGATPRRDLTLDAYYNLVYRLLWDSPQGYVTVPQHPGNWNGWTYSDLTGFAAHLPDPSTVALGVINGETLVAGLILGVEAGSIHLVTTFEALPLDGQPLTVSEASLQRLEGLLSQQFAPPAAILLCTQAVFEDWISAEDKLTTLNNATQAGEAFWKLNLKKS